MTLSLDRPDLLVVTPTLGDSPFLEATVDSVRALAFRPRQVLVAPRNRCAALRARYPDVEVIAEPAAGGMYGALNHVITTVRDWEWFTWINDDDTLLPGFAGVASAHCTAAHGHEIAYADVALVDARGGFLGVLPVERDPHRLAHVMRSGVIPLTHQGGLIGRALLEQLGGFDTTLRLAADFDLWVRAVAVGAPFHYYPELSATYRVRAGQLSGDIEQSAREVRTSLRSLGTYSGVRAAGVRVGFHARNVGRYLTRLRKTGRVRSRALFSNPP